MTDPIQEYIDEVDAEEEPGQQEEAPPAEEPAPEPEEAEEPEAEPEEELIAGKFKSTEDLAKSYLELENRFNERNDEVGELRKFREQQEYYQQQQQQQQSQIPLNQETVDWFDEQVMENPHGAAQWAMQNDSTGALYNRAVDQWYEINPRQAAAFERQWEMAILAQAMDQRYGQAIQPLTENATKQEFVNAWEQAAESLPDLNNYSDTIIEVAQQSPEILRALESGDSESKQRVIQNLYYLAKGRQADTVAQASQGAAATQAQETARVKKDASFVAAPGQRAPVDNSSNVEKWLKEVFDPAAQQYYAQE